MAKHESRTTRDHDEIRQWVEERGGRPASVRETGRGDDPGLLRIDFPDAEPDPDLEPVSWDDFFRKFDEKDLTFLYVDRTADGEMSYMNKFIYEGGREGRRSDERAQKGREGRGAGEAEGMKKPRGRLEKGR